MASSEICQGCFENELISTLRGMRAEKLEAFYAGGVLRKKTP